MTKQEQKLVKLAEKGAGDAELFLLDQIHELESELDSFKERMLEMINKIEYRANPASEQVRTFMDEMRVVVDTFSGVERLKGDRGEKGDTVVGPRGPMGHKPVAGVDYPIPENGRDGTDGKDGSPDTPEEVRDKLQSLKEDERLDKSAVKGFQEEIEELKKKVSAIPRGRVGGTRKVQITRVEDLTSQVNGVVTTYSLPRDTVRVHMVWSTQFPQILRPTTDFTFAGQTLTLTSQVGVIQSGQTLVAMIETLFYA